MKTNSMMTLCVLGLLFMSTLVNADIKGAMYHAGQEAKDAYDEVLAKAAELGNKLKNAGKDLGDQRAEDQAGLYQRSNDPYSVQDHARQFQNTLNGLHKNAEATTAEWQVSLGDRWEHFKNSLGKASKTTENKVSGAFHDTADHFKDYAHALSDKVGDLNHESQKKVNGLLNDLKEKYESYKDATAAKLNHWKTKAHDSAEDTADEAEDKLNEAYHSAKRTYHEGKQKFEDGCADAWKNAKKGERKVENEAEKVKEAADKARDEAAGVLGSFKHRLSSLKEDATNTLNQWKDKFSHKWHKNNDKFEDTIADFNGYLAAYEESAENQSSAAKERLNRLASDLKSKYNNLKEQTQRRLETWRDDEPEEKTTDWLYEQAKNKYTTSKQRLQSELNYLAGKTPKEQYYTNVKDRIQGIYSDASSTLSSWKDTFADKWTQATSGNNDNLTTSPDDFQNTIGDFLTYDAVFDETTRENTFTDNVKFKLNDLLDNLQDSYENFKDATSRRWFDWKGDNNDQTTALQVYDEAKNNYISARQRVQNEFDYLSGKLNLDEYTSRVKQYDQSLFGRVGDSIKETYRATRDYVVETVTQVAGGDKKSEEL